MGRDNTFFKLGKEIVASQIMTTLDEAYCTAENKRAKKVRWKSRKENYTMVPVRVDGLVKKFVRRSDLKDEGYISDYSTEIDMDRLISHDTEVLDLIDYFSSRSDNDRFYFVLKGNEIVGFVLPADLNKHPVCVLFYIIFSKLEIELKRVVQKHFRHDDSWLSLLLKHEKDAVLNLYKKLRDDDIEISKLECTQLKHLLRIVGKDKRLLSEIGYSSKRDFDNVVKKLADFRNPTMHPVRKLINPPKKLEDLIETKNLALQLIDRVQARKIQKDIFEIWDQEESESSVIDNPLDIEPPLAKLYDSR
jgi:hypothetical protein